MHDAAENILADVIAEILGADIRENAAENAAQAARHDNQHHPDAGSRHDAQIRNTAVGNAQNALVHDLRHQPGLPEIHRDLEHHEERGKHGEMQVFFQILPLLSIIWLFFTIILAPSFLLQYLRVRGKIERNENKGFLILVLRVLLSIPISTFLPISVLVDLILLTSNKQKKSMK